MKQSSVNHTPLSGIFSEALISLFITVPHVLHLTTSANVNVIIFFWNIVCLWFLYSWVDMPFIDVFPVYAVDDHIVLDMNIPSE